MLGLDWINLGLLQGVEAKGSNQQPNPVALMLDGLDVTLGDKTALLTTSPLGGVADDIGASASSLPQLFHNRWIIGMLAKILKGGQFLAGQLPASRHEANLTVFPLVLGQRPLAQFGDA